MARALVNGVKLYYEDVGQGVPMIFVHEFAGEAASWAPQVRFFARRYRTIAYNARGYPPSDVPEDPAAYSQTQAADDIRGMLDALKIQKAHVVGLSMGGYATLHFGLMYPERALSLVVAGAGYGSKADEREGFKRDSATIVEKFEREGMEKVADTYAIGPDARAVPGQGPVGLAGVLRPVEEAVGQGPRAHDARRADAAAVGLRADRPHGEARGADPDHDRATRTSRASTPAFT